MDDVPVFGEGGEQVLEALLQSVDLGIDQYLHNKILICVLHQFLSWKTVNSLERFNYKRLTQNLVTKVGIQIFCVALSLL